MAGTPAAAPAAAPTSDRYARGLKRVIALLAVLFVPAAIYAFYVMGQLGDIRAHDLRSLDNAAYAAADLLDNAERSIRNLLESPSDREYACTFFERQERLRLVMPRECGELTTASGLDSENMRLGLETGRSTLDIVAYCTGPTDLCLRIEVVLEALLEQVPFGAGFDRLLIVDSMNSVLGSAVTPQRTSPLLPPGVYVDAPPAPIRTLSAAVERRESSEESPGRGTLPNATSVDTVEIGGVGYTLMCQPWRAASTLAAEFRTLKVCGLKNTQLSFQQALAVAPGIVMLLLALLTIAIVSWPILKMLSVAPQERIRFGDMYLTLLATLALTMLLSASVADVATYSLLREDSRERLKALAAEIGEHLTTELEHAYMQLEGYDRTVANRVALLPDPPDALRISCLLKPIVERADDACEGANAPLALAPPEAYRALQTVYWMRPCDGRQIAKATVLFANTPVVELAGREYFEAIRNGRAWPVPSTGGFFVESGTSVTTGEFFAALSIRSALSAADTTHLAVASDCTAEEGGPFVAAVTMQPVSMRHPVLAPGVGFAVTGENGHVLFHSDERHAGVEDLFADEGIATRLRAALASRRDAAFDAHYQTRPHQIHVHMLSGLPLAVMTFADDEVLRTFHVELLARTIALIGCYLLFALLGTLLYMLVKGRQPPVWMWPRREAQYRPIYSSSVWCLSMQAVVFLFALDVLRGVTLLLACLVLPLTAIVTVVIAVNSASAVDSVDQQSEREERLERIYRLHLVRSAWTVIATTILAVALFSAMSLFDKLSAAQSRPSVATVAALALTVLLALAWLELERLRRHALLKFWRDPVAPHIVGGVVIWLLVGAFPAYGLFEFALAREATTATKMQMAYVARARASRACRIEEDLRLVAAPFTAATEDQWTDGTAKSRFARQRIDEGDSTTTNVDSTKAYSDIYSRALLVPIMPVTVENMGMLLDEEQTAAARFWGVFTHYAPIYNETTTHKRYLDPAETTADAEVASEGGPAAEGPAAAAASPRWSWSISGKTATLVYQHVATNACDAFVPTALAATLEPTEPTLAWQRVVGGLVFLVLLVAWVAFAARKLFFGAIEENGSFVGRHDAHLEGLSEEPDPEWFTVEVKPLECLGVELSEVGIDNLGEFKTRRTVVDQILDEAEEAYKELWNRCTTDMQLVLMQLVEEGFANPKQTEVVRKLLRKGLLRRDPILRPMNHSFAVFIETLAEPEELRRQEKAYSRLRLTGLRGLLLTALILVLAFLSLTQQDTVSVWVGYLTAAAASAAGILRLMDLVSRPSMQKPE